MLLGQGQAWRGTWEVCTIVFMSKFRLDLGGGENGVGAGGIATT